MLAQCLITACSQGPPLRSDSQAPRRQRCCNKFVSASRQQPAPAGKPARNTWSAYEISRQCW
eukprot:1052975-Rhodomonas_salina.1